MCAPCKVSGEPRGALLGASGPGRCQPGSALSEDKFLDCLFLYDDDGYQSYCSICCAGETLLICENPDCTRCYCFECVDALVGPGTSGRVQATSNWVCFLCLPFPRSGLLHRRQKWRGRLKAFCDRESNSLETYKTVPVWKREPVRVLSLFGDIRRAREPGSVCSCSRISRWPSRSAGVTHRPFRALLVSPRAELVSLGFLESGSAPGGLKHLDDVTEVVRKDVEAWGPFDLVYGATPPVGQACDHPPAWYLFQFHRVLQYARPGPGRRQPFFWMFVDNLVLSQDDRRVATRFLEKAPGHRALCPRLATSGVLYANAADLRRLSPDPAPPSPSAADQPPSFLASMACFVWLYFARSQKRTDAGRVRASVGRNRGACAHQGMSSSRPQPSAGWGGATPPPPPPRWRRAHGLCTFPCGPAARGPGSPRDFPDLPPCHLAGSGV
ncbi:DNA (cytosine-5)-methyltransferase 3-like isoform X2 [Meles meles]|uniref:DNA (cytosine-5)-methyltransferase 3-like isoform X2 n=1 Tax=Meles meles TaxID=9662 RepID=UPI001E699704|nr:DNA (cytosine-5)-methyltransferase 3-like isoform X2 [Meles meles]